jgi:hypothetical protein
MVVIARFYLRKKQTDVSDFAADPVNETTLYDDEALVAWSAIPLVLCSESKHIEYQ